MGRKESNQTNNFSLNYQHFISEHDYKELFFSRLSSVLHDGPESRWPGVGGGGRHRGEALDDDNRPDRGHNILLQSAGEKWQRLWPYVFHCLLQNSKRLVSMHAWEFFHAFVFISHLLVILASLCPLSSLIRVILFAPMKKI